MSKLYIRGGGLCINFVHTIPELRDFVSSYIYGSRVVLGDLAVFGGVMRSMLLKFLEDNPCVDCYSSEDIGDGVLLSRFVEVVKTPLGGVSGNVDERAFLDSDRGYMAVAQHLGLVDNRCKLLAYRGSRLGVGLLSILDKR